MVGLIALPPNVPLTVLANGSKVTVWPPTGNSMRGSGDASAIEYVFTYWSPSAELTSVLRP